MENNSLWNPRALQKFCEKAYKNTKCRDTLHCSPDKCMMALALWTDDLMQEKNLPMGEAIRLCLKKEDKNDYKKT